MVSDNIYAVKESDRNDVICIVKLIARIFEVVFFNMVEYHSNIQDKQNHTST